jgi:hypothetical protein
MKPVEHEQRDWSILVFTILVVGFLSVLVAGQLALRFSPTWVLTTNMDSQIDPNSVFLTREPGESIEPVDAAILTPPGWSNFLTPGASIITRTPFPPITSTPPPAPTTVSSATSTVIVPASPTNTFVFIPFTPTSTRKPKPTKTSPPPAATTDTPTFLPSFTPTSPSGSTPTPTPTQTSTTTATLPPTPSFTPTATQTPISIPTDPTPPEIGATPDGNVYILPAGGSLTLGITLIANGDAGYDLVYYERAAPGGNGIFLDWMIVQIGDGTNWYTVFNWGDNIADTNSNMNFNILPNPQVPEEADQRAVPTSALYPPTGIAIDVDAMLPPGTYSYIRFTAPPGDSDNQTEIDAVEVLP